MAADGLARVAAAARRFDEALAIVSKRLNDAPRAEDFALAGDVLMALGRSAEAERNYRQAEAAWRSDTPEPARMARFLADRGRTEEAIRLAEVVHEADLRDGKYPHEEARGIDVAIRALLAALPDDHQVLAQGMSLFEGLYATTPKKA